MKQSKGLIGFACSYTPLALIHAAGYTPYRILPTGNWPDQAGRVLHDNLCPHIKRILDRALYKDLPELSGMVFMNSCDAMRRLSDAWKFIRPNDHVILIDLPMVYDEPSCTFFSYELLRCAETLTAWSGNNIPLEKIQVSINQYNILSDLFIKVHGHIITGTIPGGRSKMQEFYNLSSTEPVELSINKLEHILAESVTSPQASNGGVPVFLFGNVLPDPDAFMNIESCGAHIVNDNFCTGSRLFTPLTIDSHEDIFMSLARGILSRPPCARTFDPNYPGKIADDVISEARACNARGVIGHVIKFCDPYLHKLPMVRESLKKAEIPLLILEGDCTLRTLGQHRTRIEAFIEMLR